MVDFSTYDLEDLLLAALKSEVDSKNVYLKLAVKVVKHLYLPFGVIINCDGVGDKKVELFCGNEKITVLTKIPHSEEIAQLYSDDIPFVNELTVWRKEFIKLFKQIREEIERRSSLP